MHKPVNIVPSSRPNRLTVIMRRKLVKFDRHWQLAISLLGYSGKLYVITLWWVIALGMPSGSGIYGEMIELFYNRFFTGPTLWFH